VPTRQAPRERRVSIKVYLNGRQDAETTAVGFAKLADDRSLEPNGEVLHGFAPVGKVKVQTVACVIIHGFEPTGPV
jgi:hypothetical protein